MRQQPPLLAPVALTSTNTSTDEGRNMRVVAGQGSRLSSGTACCTAADVVVSLMHSTKDSRKDFQPPMRDRLGIQPLLYTSLLPDTQYQR
jgi:hypothetical protein